MDPQNIQLAPPDSGQWTGTLLKWAVPDGFDMGSTQTFQARFSTLYEPTNPAQPLMLSCNSRFEVTKSFSEFDWSAGNFATELSVEKFPMSSIVVTSEVDQI